MIFELLEYILNCPIRNLIMIFELKNPKYIHDALLHTGLVNTKVITKFQIG